MRKFLLFFFLLLRALYADEEMEKELVTLSSVDCSPSENLPLIETPLSIVPKVDVVTGKYQENGVDMEVAGVEPLSLRRFYTGEKYTNPVLGKWFFNPESYCVANFEWKEDRFVSVGEANGLVTCYEPSSPGQFCFNPDHHRNFVRAPQGGQSHPLNTKISYHKVFTDKNSFRWVGEIVSGDGTRRSFESVSHPWLTKKKGKDSFDKKKQLFPHDWTPYQLCITEERRPDGNIICYSYSKIANGANEFTFYYDLRSITAYNSNKTKVLASLKFDPFLRGRTIEGSDGRRVVCEQKVDKKRRTLLISIQKPHLPCQSFGYMRRRIDFAETVDGRILTTEYTPDNKVRAQYAPIGPNGEIAPVAQYTYHEGATEVIDAEGNKIIYRIDGNKRITSIETYQGSSLYRVDRMEWDSATGNLVKKTIEDAKGTPLFIHEYKYDKNQNPIEEKVGDGKESQTVYRTYSEDGFNLLLSESNREGRMARYSYAPGTNLITSELIYDGDKIKKRRFHSYDDCAVCVKTILDDGSTSNPEDLKDVTTRKITIIKPKESQPCYGLPEVIEERTIDARGTELLLSKMIYTYAPFGKVLKEDHYDANDHFSYSLRREYDERERLISKSDALGNTLRYTYDANNNMLSISGPREDQRKEFVYDKANRPIKISERQSDGSFLSTMRHYDKLGRVIKTIDESGFETFISYDHLNRVTSIHKPDGAILKKEYDVLGNEIKTTDGNGYEIRRAFNYQGKPIAIFYPDGSFEYLTYSPQGLNLSKIDRNGAKTVLTYDCFDNPIETKVLAGSERIKQVTSIFSAFSLLSVTDAEGITTRFEYDFAGRKISEEKAGRRTLFGYDALGRLTTTQIGDTLYRETYDHKNRLIEKSVEDLSGKTLRLENYTYDAADNRTEVIKSNGKETLSYDCRGQLIERKDPLDHVTKFSYTYLGGLTRTEINPKGIKKIESFDCCGRVRERKICNAFGEKLRATSYRYDNNGNVTEETQPVIEAGIETKSVVTRLTYGPLDRKEKIIESDQRETRFIYDETGRLKTVVKADGSEIAHAYDSIGRLAQYASRDFDYRYRYDRNDRILEVEDLVAKTATKRSYDAFGNIVQERLANDLTLNYRYDPLGRRVAIQYPDNSEATYHYQNDQLYQIERGGLTTTYAKRDQQGYLIKASLPASLGEISYERDALSRTRSYQTPFYSEYFGEAGYDSVGNLVHYEAKDALGSLNYNFAYDDLCQLSSENGHSYSFDSLCNPLKKDEYRCASNTLCQITSDGACQYTYDKNGNLESDGVQHFAYDSQDRLIEVKKGESTLTFTYDAFHRRLSKQVRQNGSLIKSERYVWEGPNEVGLCDEKGEVRELRILGEGMGAEIGSAVFIELQGKSYVPIHDHRGCVVSLVSVDTKRVVESYRYTSFGQEIVGGTLSPWTFSSKRIDRESGLSYFGRRFYSPTLGRWISPDPKGPVDGPNLYAYLHNAPLTGIDAYGLWTNPCDGCSNFIDFVGNLFNSVYEEAREFGQWVSSNINSDSSPSESIQERSTFDEPHAHARNYREDVSRKHHRYEGQEKSHEISIQGREVPNVSVVYINGVGNELSDAKGSAGEISKAHGGVQMTLLHNCTYGWGDGPECIFLKNGVTTHTDRVIANYFNSTCEENPNMTFIVYAHSQGNQHLANAAHMIHDEVRDHIFVRSFATPQRLDNLGFGKVDHYVCPADAVTYFEPANYINPNETVHYVAPRGLNPFNFHSITGPTYKAVISDYGKKFQRQYFHE